MERESDEEIAQIRARLAALEADQALAEGTVRRAAVNTAACGTNARWPTLRCRGPLQAWVCTVASDRERDA
jgi:hypothetical protein